MGLAAAILLGVQYRAAAWCSVLEKTPDDVLPGTAALVMPGDATFAADALPATVPKPSALTLAQATASSPLRHLCFMTNTSPDRPSRGYHGRLKQTSTR